MRILVTGASGFIGRRLMPLLGGHEVLCVGRSASPNSDNVRFLARDLTRPDAWQGDLESFAPECCVHLAWDGLPDYSLARCRVNLDANLSLFEMLVRAKVRRLVVAGSCWEYGAANGPMKESEAAGPLSVFAATKHAIRVMADSIARESGIEFLWARIFFAYGPGQREAALIPHLRKAFKTGEIPSLRDPSAVNDFIHVDDVAGGLHALTTGKAPSGIFNLGSGSPTSVGEIANRVARHYGREETFSVSSGSGFWADITKAEASTEWRPTIEIGDGIERTLREMDAAA